MSTRREKTAVRKKLRERRRFCRELGITEEFYLWAMKHLEEDLQTAIDAVILYGEGTPILDV